MVVARWQDWQGNGLEHCVCKEEAEGLVLEGVVAGTRHGAYGGHYLVRTDTIFRTREVRVEYVGGPSLHIESDGEGNWRDMIAGKHGTRLTLIELLRLVFVDMSVSTRG